MNISLPDEEVTRLLANLDELLVWQREDTQRIKRAPESDGYSDEDIESSIKADEVQAAWVAQIRKLLTETPTLDDFHTVLTDELIHKKVKILLMHTGEVITATLVYVGADYITVQTPTTAHYRIAAIARIYEVF